MNATVRARARVGKRKPAKTVKASSAEGRLSEEKRLKIEVKAFLRVCEGVNTPRSLACYLLAKSGEWHQLLNLPTLDTTICSITTVPGYISPWIFQGDYSVSEMMKKNPRLPLGIDRPSVASQSFDESEELCAATNERFISYFDDPSLHYKELDRISRVQLILSRALGPLSRKKLDSLPTLCRFGPGASSAVTGLDVIPSRKFTCEMHVSPRLHEYARAITGDRLIDESQGFSLRSYSTYSTVPKNAKTDRSICIEPHLNIYVQLGVGALLRHSLRALGLEPDDQSRNREMASSAWKDGYATIDMSMASDLISSQVVFRLLPDNWFHLLYMCRTDFVEKDGEVRGLHKFSSMGNGYTWELQSLIFYSIARSLTDKPLGVFGDDLLVPTEIVSELFEALTFFGFRVNDRKSFWQGGFRESCGADYYCGVYARPFFFKRRADIYDTEASFRIHLANGLRIMGHLYCGGYGCDDRYRLPYIYLTGYPGVRESAIPRGFGDGGLIVDFDEATPQRAPRGWCGWLAKVYVWKQRRSKRTDVRGALLRALHTPNTQINQLDDLSQLGSDEWSYVYENVRNSGHQPSLRRQVVPYWEDLGPWI